MPLSLRRIGGIPWGEAEKSATASPAEWEAHWCWRIASYQQLHLSLQSRCEERGGGPGNPLSSILQHIHEHFKAFNAA